MAELAELTGTDRAAVLLLALGERTAAEVLRQLDPREVQRLGTAMTRLNHLTQEQVQAVVAEFAQRSAQESPLTVGVDDYVRKVFTAALGEQRGRGVVERILDSAPAGLGALKWLDARTLAGLCAREHPQVGALVLAALDADQAAAVLALLDSALRAELMVRVATLDELPAHALRELTESLEQQVLSRVALPPARLGGVRAAAGIVGRLAPSHGAELIESLKEIDPDAGAAVEDNLFVFEDLGGVDDKGLQALLREVPAEVLLIALKGADQVLRDRFFKNMSRRAAEILREDMELRGPVRLSEVESAQRDMLAGARRLAEAGTLRLGRGGEDLVG